MKGILRNRTGDVLVFAVVSTDGHQIYRLPKLHCTSENVYPVAVMGESDFLNKKGSWIRVTGADSVVYRDGNGLKIKSRFKLKDPCSQPQNPSTLPEGREDREAMIKDYDSSSLLYQEEDYQLGLAADFVTKGTSDADRLIWIKKSDAFDVLYTVGVPVLPKVWTALHKLSQDFPEGVKSVYVKNGWEEVYETNSGYKNSHFTGRAVDLKLARYGTANKQLLMELAGKALENGFYHVQYVADHNLIHCCIQRSEYLERLKHPVHKVNYAPNDSRPDRVTFAHLRSERSEGWWSHLLNYHFDIMRGQPVVLLPEGVYSESDIRVFPEYPNVNWRLGDFVLRTAWQQHLTPRAYFASFSDRVLKRPTLEFVPKPKQLEQISTVPPTIQTLDCALQPFSNQPDVGLDTLGGDTRRNDFVKEVINTLQKVYKNMSFIIHSALVDLQVGFKMDAFVSLPQILDQLCLLINAVWDWHGDMCVYVMSKGEVIEPAAIKHYEPSKETQEAQVIDDQRDIGLLPEFDEEKSTKKSAMSFCFVM